ncbi:hypothetical protein Ccrd_000756 [Cynara cardunculus var. scolymus]|uniref:Uncharacterized protein n=1 Tax=Cynara cardunculus var. scolymus TaxID=59895 RepID=A0A103XUG3_CYNCS|nr:hypothetical protein Ccrd_000756 [Cynara cardunculus var. scolymus]
MVVEVQVISGDTLLKVALFILVQALVYLIITNSSNIFSTSAPTLRATSFKTARSASIRRIVAAFSDFPADNEVSPSTKTSKT